MLLRQQLLLLTTLFVYATHHALCDQLYDEKKEVCCDGTLHAIPLNETDGYRCCGSQLLLNRNGICCYNTIVPYPYDVTEGYSDWGCCKSGDQVNPYNLRTQRCCHQGHVIDVGANHSVACCGNTTFDFSQGVCCNNVVHVTGNSNRYGCCGDQPFSKDTHMCCSWRLDTNDLFKRKLQFNLQPFPDYVEARFDLRCCGLEIYNTKSKMCCNGVLHQLPTNSTNSQCCGKKLLNDANKEICCPGDIVRLRDNKNQDCCGDGLYDQEHEHCCGSQVISKAANVSCCWDLGIVYNPTTNVCCGDPLMPRPIDYSETLTKTRCCHKHSK